MATETRTRYRSAVSGKYVKKEIARRAPRTTVSEKDRVRTTVKKKPTVRPAGATRVTSRRGSTIRKTR